MNKKKIALISVMITLIVTIVIIIIKKINVKCDQTQQPEEEICGI